MNKITYLFGAGASKHALPIVEEIPKRIKSLIEFLQSEELQCEDYTPSRFCGDKDSKTAYQYQCEMITSLEWLLESSNRHETIDNFARKLTVHNNISDLKKLKIALSIFFIMEQFRNPPDPRYDTFIASLIDDNCTLPKNIQILSWNYDYQFEIAFAEYSQRKEIIDNQKLLQVFTKYNNFRERDGFKIFKLNGSTELSSTGVFENMYTDSIYNNIDKNFIYNICCKYAQASNSISIASLLSFAWENGDNSKHFFDRVIQNTQDTYELVVIGYSFPHVNREIDKRIIWNMKNLRKVYFQSPDADLIIERFKNLVNYTESIQVIPYSNCSRFIIPSS
jgi:hypothetical protein